MSTPILEKNRSPIPAFLEKDRQNRLVEEELKRIIGYLSHISSDSSIRPKNLPELNKELRKLAFQVWEKHAANSIRATHNNGKNGCVGCAKCTSGGKCKKMKAKKRKNNKLQN